MKRIRRFGARLWYVSSNRIIILLPIVLLACAWFIVWYWQQPMVRVMTGIRYLCDETAKKEAFFLYGLDVPKLLMQYINADCEMTGYIRFSGMESCNITVNGDYVLRRDLEHQRADLSMKVSVLRIPVCEVEGYADPDKCYLFVTNYLEEGVAFENIFPLFEKVTTVEDTYGQLVAEPFETKDKNSWFKKHRDEIRIEEEGKGEDGTESFLVKLPGDVKSLTCRVCLTGKNRVKELELLEDGVTIRLYGDNLNTFEMILNDTTSIKAIKLMPENEYIFTLEGIADAEPYQIQGKMKLEHRMEQGDCLIVFDDVECYQNEKKRIQIDVKARLGSLQEEIAKRQDLERTAFVEIDELLQIAREVLR